MKISFVLLLVLWVALAVTTALFDMQISQLLFNANSGWAIFLENYGMLPGLVVLIIAANLYYLKISKEKPFLFYLKKIFLFVVISFFYFYFLATINHLFDDGDFILKQSFLILVVIAFSIGLISLMALHFSNSTPNDKLIKFSKVSLILGGIGYLIFIQGTKTLWGRVRFRELNIDYSNFTNWFEPQGITSFDSFPSGHAAMAWMVLPLLILTTSKSRTVKVFTVSVITIWAISVAISRIVMGAHYASDVTFASFIIIFTYLILKQIINNDKITE